MTPFGSFRWRSFVAILASTLTFVIVLWVSFPPTYRTNDDVAIRCDLEGLTTPDAAPTGYALFTTSLLGWTLVSLQRVVPVHGWDFVVGGLLIIAIAVILAHAWSLSRGVADHLLTLAAALIVIVPLLRGMQFTISATLAGSAAMITAARELLVSAPRRSVLLGSAVLLFFGVLVRPLGATAGALLAAVMMVPVALCDRDVRRVRLMRLMIAVAAVALTAGALAFLNRWFYALSPVWSAYQQDHRVARLFDWGGEMPATLVRSLRMQVGWTANDWELLRRQWSVDPRLYSHARLDKLYGAWSALVDWRLRSEWLMQRVSGDLTRETFFRLFTQSATPLAAATLVAIAAAGRRGVVALLTLTAMLYAASFAIEIAFKELPFRLFAPLHVCFFLAVLLTSRVLRRSMRPWLTTLCALVAVVLLASETWTLAFDAQAEDRQSREIDAQVSQLLQLHPSLLVLHSDAFPAEYWWRPFRTPRVRLAAVQLGLDNQNPYLQSFLTRSYQPSLLHAMCTDPSIVVISEKDRLEPVTTYMKEHYGTDVEWMQVYSGSFRAWRCSPIRRNNAAPTG